MLQTAVWELIIDEQCLIMLVLLKIIALFVYMFESNGHHFIHGVTTADPNITH